jgi:tetratricopeptide (TPR) repeat protein
MALGHLATAHRHFQDHLHLSRKIGFRQGEAIALLNLAALLTVLGRARSAEDVLVDALALCREMPWPAGEACALHYQAVASSVAGDHAEARKRFVDALARLRSAGDPDHLAAALAAFGGMLAQQGRCDEALGRTARAATLLARSHRATCVGSSAEDECDAFEQGKRYLQAHERVEAAYVLWQCSGRPPLLAEAAALLSEMAATLSEEDRASMLDSVAIHRAVRQAVVHPARATAQRATAPPLSGTLPVPSCRSPMRMSTCSVWTARATRWGSRSRRRRPTTRGSSSSRHARARSTAASCSRSPRKVRRSP